MRIFSLILLSLTLLFTQLSVNSVYAADVSVADFFDIDNDGKKEALSDGLLISRYLFGFRGNALIDQAIASGATRTTATAIETYLTDNLAKFDVDGDGETKALSDGLLILRYLFGFRGEALINNAVASGATRTTAIQVATYITEGGESDPEFIRKAEAIAFNQINLYQGHVKEGDANPVDLNVANLKSGDLFTVDVEFEISEDLDDYALTAQLIPMDIFNKLNTGNTLGVVSSENVTAEESKRIIDLGGAYIDEIKSGILHGVIHAKLPTLENDTTYKVVVTPTLDFLATHKNVIKADYKKVPLLIDPRELVVHKLDKVRVEIVNLPDITEKNDFTQLEKYERYDTNGYSLEPLFQTSLEVDVSSFNQSEEVVISLSWECKEQSCYDKGVAGKYELGLWDPKSGGDLSHDQKISSDVIIGHTYTTNGAHHNVKSSGRSYSNYSYGRIRTVIIPLAPYIDQPTHDALVTQCLSFNEIASATPKIGNFILDVKHVIEGKLIDTGINYTLSIPLVCQDNRAKELSNEQASGFSVLRAGNTNQACLDIPRSAYEGDPLEGTETGFLEIDANEEIIASTCPENSPNTSLLWRYSKHTKQFISKDVDSNGDHYCLTSRSTGLVYADMPLGGADIPGGFPGGFGGGEFTEVDIKKCEFQQVGIAPPEQRFELVGDKIKAVDNRYLTVSNIGSSSAFALEDVELVSLNHTPAPVDFFTNTKGVNVDRSGRLFYIGKSKAFNLGDDEFAAISLSFSGESYIDYMPVVGTTTHGEAELTASIFGARAKLAEATFIHQRYLSKKLSSTVGTNYPVEVGDGAEVKVTILGNLVYSKGKWTPKTVTQSFNPLTNLANELNSEQEIVPFRDAAVNLSVDAKILNITFVIIAIPVRVEGGIEGSYKLDIGLGFKTPGNTNLALGIEGGLTMETKLNGYVTAKATAGIAAAGIEADLEFINQSLAFTTGAGFKPKLEGISKNNKLSFDMNTDLVAKLKLIKGELIGYIEYYKPCLCTEIARKVRKETTLYESPYLFNSNWDIYTSGQINIVDIDF